jgi:putative aminopeptidase FrvX
VTQRGGQGRGHFPAISLLLAFTLTPATVRADEVEDVRGLVRALASVGGVAGREEQVRAAIRKAAPTWASFQEDNLGNLTVSVGSGKPGLLLLAHMDEPGYVVSGITEQGYLKLQRLARTPLSPLFDQFHIGQPLIVQTRRGPLSAVCAVASTHLWRGSALPAGRPIADEDLFVDIGARSAAEVEVAGVALLDPVVIARRIVDLAGGRIAGPAMDDRAGCAALVWLLQTLEPAKIRGTLTVGFSAQGLLGSRGAARLANRFETEDVLVVEAPPAGPGRAMPAPGRGPAVAVASAADGFSQDIYNLVAQHAGGLRLSPQNVPYGPSGDQEAFGQKRRVLPIGVPVQYPGTPGEIVDVHDVVALATLLKSIAESDR